jgi:hypothetical protein
MGVSPETASRERKGVRRGAALHAESTSTSTTENNTSMDIAIPKQTTKLQNKDKGRVFFTLAEVVHKSAVDNPL